MNLIQPRLRARVVQVAAGCARRPDRADQLIAEFDGNAPANKNQVRKLSEQAGKPRGGFGALDQRESVGLERGGRIGFVMGAI